MSTPRSSTVRLLIAASAAFGTYFCMYAFRKPFTAGTFEGQEIWGLGLKTTLVISQLLGYMLSKFIGIKVISEMRAEYRAATIVGLILTAEAALVGFAYAPLPLKVAMMFLNGLPLGMVFGLVLGYLEGRRQTEALSAALCASFIISSGVVKSVGRWLIDDWGISEFHMPMLTGLIFLLPLFVSVWVLQATPPPDDTDRLHRSHRTTMLRSHRQQFLTAYWPGLSLLVFVYVAITVIRTIRDDFGVEIWRDMGVNETPSVFARAEIVVAFCVTALNAFAIWIASNRVAMRVTMALMCAALLAVGASVGLQMSGRITPFVFMVACGVGLYVPYVAFHTTVFERLIAASRRPCNLGFLMYLADAIGYLGYAVVIALRTTWSERATVLPFFLWTLLTVGGLSIIGLLLAIGYFEKVLARDAIPSMDGDSPANDLNPPTIDELAP
ncbi:MAG: hypothetical protein KDA47_06590, partial [Planctomycetales bacterium]|nr:hypothetical protein [Planctomycetales bacterium]